MSLATLRTHVWKGGSDIILYYKANGRKVIQPMDTTIDVRNSDVEGAVEGATAVASTTEAKEATQVS
jgi:WD repeat-containing protein 48